MKTKVCFLSAVLFASGACFAHTAQQKAQQILSDTGVKGGLVVHLGCGDGELTTALRANDSFTIHGLAADAEDVKKARDYILSKDLYGPVSVAQFDPKHLPYIDNLVNLVVCDSEIRIPKSEIQRVLAPGGVLLVEGEKIIKPWPDDIDQWPQYLHAADNNGVAEDTVAGPPRHLQWYDEPAWSRSHIGIPSLCSMVSAGGRLFSIEDRGSIKNSRLPGRWYLIARDAFNGVTLWKRKFDDWEPVTRYVKDIAVQLQRRLAADDNVVYVTPGLDAPLTQLDAATGETIKIYKGTNRTQEFALCGDVLYLVIGDRMNAARYNIVKPEPRRGTNLGGSDPKAPFGGTGWRSSYARQIKNKKDTVCDIVAIDKDSQQVLWRRPDIHNYVGGTLAARGEVAVFQTYKGLTCLDRKTGETRWKAEKKIRSKDGTEPNVVVLADDMVYSQEWGDLFAYSLTDAKEIWRGRIPYNYEKTADLFVIDDQIWVGGASQPTAYNRHTGKKIKTLHQKMTGPMSHDRCYRNFITERFYINSKTGGADFVELKDGEEFPHHWTRSTCGFGPLPCNGLVYVGPYSCKCSQGVMKKGYNAYAPQGGLKSSGQDIPVERDTRLLKGPAYGKIRNPKSEIRNVKDWPTYRHDGARSGVSPAKVPSNLQPIWKADFQCEASQPVIVGGMVFVALGDEHAVCALDAENGSVQWRFIAGGRVDSPPTYYKGHLLFGCRDGWVYCLRASDGELAWRFKGMPERLIVDRGQLESAWPVNGSILVFNDIAYFAAGRNSFLDGGIFLYALNPHTGEVIHNRNIYGPFNENGFPATRHAGFKNDIPVTDGKRIYLRHKAFNIDLKDARRRQQHIVPAAGFTDSTPQHRTYWTVSSGLLFGCRSPAGINIKKQWNVPWGDILVSDGERFFEVRGDPVKRHSYFDPRLGGYLLYAGALEGKRNKLWSSRIKINGEAMVMAGEILFVAGRPLYFPPNHPVEKFQKSYAGELGGVLLAIRAGDGEKLAEVKLDSPVVWDGMSAANDRLFVSLTDGTVMCLGE